MKIERVVAENETHEVILVTGQRGERAEVPEGVRGWWVGTDREQGHIEREALDVLEGEGWDWEEGDEFDGHQPAGLLVLRPKTTQSLFTREEDMPPCPRGGCDDVGCAPVKGECPTSSPASVAPRELKKLDAGKTRMDLLPGEALTEIADVLTFGAEKYAPWAWAGGMAWSRLLAAALRHVFAWAGGEDKDPESGKSHLAHAACCLVFLIVYGKRGLGKDDRHVYEEAK